MFFCPLRVVFFSRQSFCCTILNVSLTFISFPETKAFHCESVTATVAHRHCGVCSALTYCTVKAHTNTHVRDLRPTSQPLLFLLSSGKATK